MTETVQARADGVRERATRPVFVPRADVSETADALVIELDLPGVKSDKVEVHFERGELTVRAAGEEFDNRPRSWLAVEYQPGDFARSFRISPEVDASRITAELKNGVLTLSLPKAESSKSRRIDVRGE